MYGHNDTKLKLLKRVILVCIIFFINLYIQKKPKKHNIWFVPNKSTLIVYLLNILVALLYHVTDVQNGYHDIHIKNMCLQVVEIKTAVFMNMKVVQWLNVMLQSNSNLKKLFKFSENKCEMKW